MALLFIDGFDQYDDDAEIQRGGWTGNFTSINSFAAGRDGIGRALQITGTSITASKNFSEIANATFVCGVAFKNPNSGPQNVDLISLYYGSTEKITLRSTSGGELALDQGATQLGITSGLALAQNTWYHVEIKVLLNNTTGTYELKVDGQSKFSGTSTDTLNGTTAKVNRLILWGHATSDPVYDDIFVLDDSGSDATDFLGDCYVETIKPDADGATNNFTRVGGGTNNYEAVDDMAPPDDDTTYNHSSTATHKDLYGFAAIAGNPGTVYAVAVSLLARKEDAGYREIRTVARSNVTEVDSGNKPLGVTYKYIDHIYENDPNGGGNWTESAVNSAQFGIKLQT